MFAIAIRIKSKIFNLTLKKTSWSSSWRSLQLSKVLTFFSNHSGLCPVPQTCSLPPLVPSLVYPLHPFIWPTLYPNSSSRKPSLTTTTQTMLSVLSMLPLAPCVSTLFYSLYLSLISLSTPCFTPGLGDLRVGMLSVLSILTFPVRSSLPTQLGAM